VITANDSLGHRGDGSQEVRGGLSRSAVVSKIDEVLARRFCRSGVDHSALVKYEYTIKALIVDGLCRLVHGDNVGHSSLSRHVLE
jgi:hypothetical protein